MGDEIHRVPAEPRPIIDLLSFQKEDVESEARFNWSNWSRQVGKSFSKSLRRILRGIKRQKDQVFLSAGERQSRELMQKAAQHVKALGMSATIHEHTYVADATFKQLEIVLPNSIRIIGLPANPNTARGFTADVLLDEFAMHRDDREIWASVFPTVLRGEGELDVCSTPKGRDNVFYALAANEQFRHSTVTIIDAVKAGLPVDIEQIRKAMGDDDLFRQEFMCEFLDQAMSLLTYEQIAECENGSLIPPVGPLEAADLIAGLEADKLYTGVDIGRHRDLTVAWVLEPVDGALVTRAVIELRGLMFREQKQLLWPLMEKCTRSCLDASGLGMQMAEEAVEEFGAWKVEPVTFTLQSKGEMAGPLALRVQDATIRIPVAHEIRNDWHSITRSPTASGAFRYLAERTLDGHADRFWAAALAVRAAQPGETPWRGEVFSAGKTAWRSEDRREPGDRRRNRRPAVV